MLPTIPTTAARSQARGPFSGPYVPDPAGDPGSFAQARDFAYGTATDALRMAAQATWMLVALITSKPGANPSEAGKALNTALYHTAGATKFLGLRMHAIDPTRHFATHAIKVESTIPGLTRAAAEASDILADCFLGPDLDLAGLYRKLHQARNILDAVEGGLQHHGARIDRRRIG